MCLCRSDVPIQFSKEIADFGDVVLKGVGLHRHIAPVHQSSDTRMARAHESITREVVVGNIVAVQPRSVEDVGTGIHAEVCKSTHNHEEYSANQEDQEDENDCKYTISGLCSVDVTCMTGKGCEEERDAADEDDLVWPAALGPKCIEQGDDDLHSHHHKQTDQYQQYCQLLHAVDRRHCHGVSGCGHIQHKDVPLDCSVVWMDSKLVLFALLDMLPV